jgi:hypothetical protein
MKKILVSIIALSLVSQASSEEILGGAKLFGTAGDRDNGAHIEATVTGSTHPIYQNLNWGADNVSLNFDVYFNGGQWINSSTARGYQIYKSGNKIRFTTSEPAAAGSPSVFTDVLTLDNKQVGYGTNNSRTEVNCTPNLFGATMQSGHYECSNTEAFVGQWPAGAGSWWHLTQTRHSNPGNNYAMQIAGSFFDQQLFYRKVNNNGATAWTKVKAGDDFYGSRANLLLTGGGTITHSATGELKWTERFIILGGGRGTAAGIASQSGYYDINMPPVGTVIVGTGGAPSQTVNANGIPMPQWTALYYKLNKDANAVSVSSNFILVSYNGVATVTDDMVLIAVTNSDTIPTLKLGNGQSLFRNNSTFKGGTPVSITNYANTAAALADTNLPVGANYTVNVAGSKQLYVK